MSETELRKLRRQLERASYPAMHGPEGFQAYSKLLHDLKLTKYLPKLKPTGPDARGKTNLLSLLGRARTMRTHEVAAALQGLWSTWHNAGWFRNALPEEIVAAVAVDADKRPRRRRSYRTNEKPLTEKQTDAIYIVGEHKGNITSAARATGRTRQAMSKSYHAAMRKMGQKAGKSPKTVRLPQDRREQVNLSEPQPS